MINDVMYALSATAALAGICGSIYFGLRDRCRCEPPCSVMVNRGVQR